MGAGDSRVQQELNTEVMSKSYLRDWEVVSGNCIAPKIACSNCKFPFPKTTRKYDSDGKTCTGVYSAEGHILCPEPCIKNIECISLLSILLATIYLCVVTTGFNFGVR